MLIKRLQSYQSRVSFGRLESASNSKFNENDAPIDPSGPNAELLHEERSL